MPSASAFGDAVGAHVEAGIREARIGAEEVSPANVRLNSEQGPAELPIVARLPAGDGTGGTNRVAVERWPEWVGNIRELQAAAEVRADVEAVPIVTHRVRG